MSAKKAADPCGESTAERLPNACHDSTATHPTPIDYEPQVAAQVAWAIHRAIRRGELRLAAQCRCGRWQFVSAERAHIEPHCTAEAAEVNR